MVYTCPCTECLQIVHGFECGRNTRNRIDWSCAAAGICSLPVYIDVRWTGCTGAVRLQARCIGVLHI